MTLKQKKFIEAYKGNGVEAARIAGYGGSDATLSQIAHENMRKPNIKKALECREKPEQIAQKISRESLQQFWLTVMGDNSIGLKDRLKASELLAKSEGVFIVKQSQDDSMTLEDLVVGSYNKDS